MTQKISSESLNVNPFLQKHSAVIRISHWVIFILITMSIITVILNSTLLDPRNNAGVVRGELQKEGVVLTEKQAFFTAHHFDDRLWDLHKILGIGIAVMLAIRIIAEFFLTGEERLKNRISSAFRFYREGSPDRDEYRHYLIIKWSYILFYILLIYMSLTGLALAFGREVEFLGKAHRTIKEIHGAGQWVVYLFVIFHIGGVILEDLGKAKGIVSGMINGNKQNILL